MLPPPHREEKCGLVGCDKPMAARKAPMYCEGGGALQPVTRQPGGPHNESWSIPEHEGMIKATKNSALLTMNFRKSSASTWSLLLRLC